MLFVGSVVGEVGTGFPLLNPELRDQELGVDVKLWNLCRPATSSVSFNGSREDPPECRGNYINAETKD